MNQLLCQRYNRPCGLVQTEAVCASRVSGLNEGLCGELVEHVVWLSLLTSWECADIKSQTKGVCMFSKACLSSKGYNIIIIHFFEREGELCAGQKPLPYDLFQSEAIHSQTHLISIFSCRQKQQQQWKKDPTTTSTCLCPHIGRKSIKEGDRVERLKEKQKTEGDGGIFSNYSLAKHNSGRCKNQLI